MKYHLHNRPDREITSTEEIDRLLKKGKYVTIALCRENEPYLVTLSYGYDSENNALYFHAAHEGMKMDFLKANPKVCASILEDGGYVQENCEHHFKTLIIRGTMQIVKDLEEMKHGMHVLLNQLEEKPSDIQRLQLKSEGMFSTMAVLKLSISTIHGKAGK